MLDMGRHFEDLFLDVMSREVDKFPEVLMNTTKTNWNSGMYYTFDVEESRVIDHNKALVLYQKLVILEVDKELKRTDIGKTSVCIYVDDQELYEAVFNYKKLPEYDRESLNKSLKTAFKNVIEGFGNGINVEGINFIANRDDLLLSQEDIVEEFVNRLGTQFGMFYVDLMSEVDLDDGQYLINFESREVLYEEDNGWSVILEVSMKDIETGEVEIVGMKYVTGLESTNNDPEISELRAGVDYILDSFKMQFPEWDELGVSLFIDDIKEEDIELERLLRKFKKIRGTDEDTEYWFSRFEDILRSNKEELRNIIENVDVIEYVGVKLQFINDVELVLGEGGIMTWEGKEVYIKKEMNLQRGLKRLAQLIGRNNVSLNIMRTYDYRKKAKEGV